MANVVWMCRGIIYYFLNYSNSCQNVKGNGEKESIYLVSKYIDYRLRFVTILICTRQTLFVFICIAFYFFWYW